MKILLAGGAGYIGSVLAPELKKRGHEVEVADACWFGNYLPDDIAVNKTDLFQLKEEDLADFDQVIFLAGVSNDPMAEFSPADNFIYNAALPAYLAYTAKRAGVKRFIYASSCSVYGFTDGEAFTEDFPAVSSYPYGISKLQGEKAVLQMMDAGFSVICFRQGTLSGYSPRMRFDLLLNTMVKNAFQQGRIVINNANIWRPLISIKDVAEAYSCAVLARWQVSGVYNISMGNYTLLELGRRVQDFLIKTYGGDIGLQVLDKCDYRNYKVSAEKAFAELGFRASFTVEDIILDVIRHRKEYGDFSNPSYFNIEIFKELRLMADQGIISEAVLNQQL